MILYFVTDLKYTNFSLIFCYFNKIQGHPQITPNKNKPRNKISRDFIKNTSPEFKNTSQIYSQNIGLHLIIYIKNVVSKSKTPQHPKATGSTHVTKNKQICNIGFIICNIYLVISEKYITFAMFS